MTTQGSANGGLRAPRPGSGWDEPPAEVTPGAGGSGSGATAVDPTGLDPTLVDGVALADATRRNGTRRNGSGTTGGRHASPEEPPVDEAPPAVPPAASTAAGAPPAEAGGIDLGDTGTWRVGEAEGSTARRITVVLRYLLGRLAIDHVRRLTVWAWLVPVLGLLLLIVLPRLVALAVVLLGAVLVLARTAMVRLLQRLSLAGRFRPVEEELRDAVEAGKANLRGELRRVGLPSRSWRLPLYVVRLARGSSRSLARSSLREVEVHRVLPQAQVERALRVLDEATSRPG